MGIVTVTGEEAKRRRTALGHTRRRRWSGHVPNWDAQEKEAELELNFILRGVSRIHEAPLADSVNLNYLKGIRNYVNRFYHRFQRETQARLIKVLYFYATAPKQKASTIDETYETLKCLIEGARLTRDDLVLPWRPVYDLYYSIYFGKNVKVSAFTVLKIAQTVKKFFAVDCSRDIWEELTLYRQLGRRSPFTSLCYSFLPTNLSLEQHATVGAVIWWKEIWSRYEILEINGGTAALAALELFVKLQKQCPGFIDWRPMYERVFSDVLRNLQFPSKGRGKAIPEAAAESENTTAHVCFIVYTYGIENGCDAFLWTLFDFIGHELHPLHEDAHSVHSISLIASLVNEFVTRYIRERVKPTKAKIAPAYRLSDDALRTFVLKTMPLIMPAMFAELGGQLLPSMLRRLAFLAPDVVLPQVLERALPSLRTSVAPGRVPHLLLILSNVALPITRSKMMLRDVRTAETVLDEFNNIVQGEAIPAVSVRACAILILDEIVDYIDLADIDRTLKICSLMRYFFNCIPIMDASRLASDGLTEEEKLLAAATAKLPAIVDRAVERLVSIVNVSFMAGALNGDEALGSLATAKEHRNSTSEDDALLDGVVFLTLNAIADAAQPSVVENVAAKLLNQVLTCVYEDVNASRIFGSFISFLTKHTPHNWHVIFKHVYSKLSSALDAETRKKKVLPNDVLWYAQMVVYLCNVRHDLVHKHADDMFALIKLQLSCANKRVFQQAVKALCSLLFHLLWTVPSMATARQKTLQAAANPLAFYGTTYSEDSFCVSWHVADAADVQLATRFMSFVFEALDKLEKPQLLDQDSLQNNLYVVSACYEQVVWMLPKPPFRRAESKITTLPVSEDCLPDPDPSMVILLPDGSQLTTRMLDAMDRLIGHLRGSDDVDALLAIAETIVFLLSPCNANLEDLQYLEILMEELMKRGNDALTNEGTFYYCEKAVDHESVSNSADKRGGEYDEQLDRAVRMLCSLAVNRYTKVANLARSSLQQLCQRYRGAQVSVAEMLVTHMASQTLPDEALEIIFQTALACSIVDSSYPDTRLLVWSAVLQVKELHRSGAIDAYQRILNTAYTEISSHLQCFRAEKAVEYPKEFFDICELWRSTVPQTRVWINFERTGGYAASLAKFNAHLARMRQAHRDVIRMFQGAANNSKLIFSQRLWARKMLLRVQKKHLDLESTKLALEWLTDEIEDLRSEASKAIVHYLKKHKPKRVPLVWTPPARDPALDAGLCGVLPHLVPTCYDHRHLPCTEPQWNATIFVRNAYEYRFPRTMTVTQPRSLGEPIDRRPLTENEALIEAYFESREHWTRIVNFVICQKNGGEGCFAFQSEADTVKYLLRNFPKHDALFRIVTEQIKLLMVGRQREQHSLALDMLTGLLIGTRHYPFAQLEDMWLWLKPALRQFVDSMHPEVESNWDTMIQKVLTNRDWRQFYWLVELAVELTTAATGSATRTISSRKFEMRFTPLLNFCIRRCDVFNRVAEAAWRFCSSAFMETDRVIISATLLFVALSTESSNVSQSLVPSIPKRLLPMPFELIIRKFRKELHFIASRSSSVSPPGGANHFKDVAEGDLFKALLRLQKTSPLRLGQKRRQSPAASPQSANSPTHPKTRRVGGASTPTPTQSPLDKASCQSSQTSSSPGVASLRSSEDTSLLYLRILIDVLIGYYSMASKVSTPYLASLIAPLLLLCSDEDDDGDESAETALRGTRQQATNLVFDFMAPAPVRTENADNVLLALEKTYEVAPHWRVKIAVLRFAQTSVTYNYYIFQKPSRQNRIRALVLSGVSDASIEIRKVAANFLISLLETSFLEATDTEFQERFFKMCGRGEVDVVRESGCVGVCALVMACPPGLPARSSAAYEQFAQRYHPLLRKLCDLAHDPLFKVREYAGNCLRSFHAARRDEWPDTRELFGKELSDAIENAGEPPYCV